MNSVHALNDALTISLSAFLLSFVAYLVLTRPAARRRERVMSALKQIRPIVWRPREVQASAPRPVKKRWNSAPIQARGAAWAMTVSAVVFAFLCFGRHGSRTDTVSLSSGPDLRLTWLDYQPVAHGFRLEGHVWNESNQTLRNVQTTVLALDASGKAVGQVQGAVTPDNLEPGKRGRFLIMCEQSWAETNHELRFTSGQNLRLKYVEQYPPTRISFSNTRED